MPSARVPVSVVAALAAAVLLVSGLVAAGASAASQALSAKSVTGAAASAAAAVPAKAPARRSSRQWPPTPQSVGVPDGASLSRYRGGCVIRQANKVIAKKVINCSPLRIETTGVKILRSKINGAVQVGTQDDYEPTRVSDPQGKQPIRVTIRRSEIDAGAGRTGDFRPISSSHYIVTNSYLHGTYSGAECHNACTIKWSYVTGFGSHASGMRILRNGTLKHNTIWCRPNRNSDDDGNGVPDEDGGCSGNLTMYEEFGTPHNNVVRHNYFPAGSFWYNLKFNGSDRGKIRIVNNRFGRPKTGGRHVADDWNRKRSNRWSGNTFKGGATARP